MYVIGANPRVGIINGFSKRIWGHKNIDKIIPIKKGVFIVRFLNNETKNKALKMQNLMIDNKPIFLKQWVDGMEFDR